MDRQLRHNYYCQLLPALAALAAILGARAMHLLDADRWQCGPDLASLLFVLAVVLAAAAPVLLRTAFAHRRRQAKSTPLRAFIRFQQWLLRIALLTPYIAIIACLFKPPRFHQIGIILATLYALYYHYPSRRRIAFDRRIYRVE